MIVYVNMMALNMLAIASSFRWEDVNHHQTEINWLSLPFGSPYLVLHGTGSTSAFSYILPSVLVMDFSLPPSFGLLIIVASFSRHVGCTCDSAQSFLAQTFFFLGCWCCAAKRLQLRQNSVSNTHTWSMRPLIWSPWSCVPKRHQRAPYHQSQRMFKLNLDVHGPTSFEVHLKKDHEARVTIN